MSKIMKPTPMSELMARVVGEWIARDGAYDIPGALTRRVLEFESRSPGFAVNGLKLAVPIGPAAGPHTQIAPNLVASWLAGSRVFELKTVQKDDRLDIAKPCIDALDEGHNVEWSTELRLEEARAEYLRGWIAIHALRAALSEKPGAVMFNLSVGYTLEGIQGATMDAFIEGMRAPSGTPVWETALREAQAAVEAPSFARAFGAAGAARAAEALRSIPTAPIHSVTLSTMHGCPPAEIERIGAYLIEEKGFDAYVKLNPTLLGYDEVRGILDRTGWRRIQIQRPTFEHDLQFDAALGLVASLRRRAAARGVRFGVKLSNTLANVNDGARLPGAERYMSGRALFPITIRLAAKLAVALPDVPFSYCGGIDGHNAFDCFSAGLGPLTVVTDILKPGGYLRLEPIAREAVRALEAGVPGRPDAARLSKLAEAALADPVYSADFKQGEVKIRKSLPLTDCFAAPCVEACPAGQRPPEYMAALAAGEAEKALAIVLADNPLPHVTGVLCDHKCMEACSRLDYEGPVAIRAMKLLCARSATIPPVRKPAVTGKGRAAVFGAGPAGLACAHYLALEGYPVTVFDTAAEPGGVPANVIPEFRIERAELAADVERIAALGAELSFGHSGEIDPAALRKAGYSAVVVATGAPVPRTMPLEGSGARVVDALEFLHAAHGAGQNEFAGAKAIVVAGGGNTAMDAARVAARLPGKPHVSLLYRRTLAEMPADREELAAALADGVEYAELSLPERLIPSAGAALPRLCVREMALGEPDASGRRAPVATERTRELPCDLLIAAVGESPDRELFEKLGARVGPDGRPVVDPATLETTVPGLYATGDARRGPASIIAAEADGRLAAYAILRTAGIEPRIDARAPRSPDGAKLARRGELLPGLAVDDPAFARREAERCLECDTACLRCVEVCPNRANVALPVAGGGPLKQGIQIVHVDDLCNECGNCGFFCPYEGEPCTDKPTLFRDEAALRASANAGFAFAGPAAEPALIFRAEPGRDAAVSTLPYAAWHERAGRMPLLAIASTIHDSHRYLVAGGTLPA